MALPSDSDIRARAEKDGLLEPGAELSHNVRRSVAKTLLAEQQKATTPPPVVTAELLSRTTQPALGGVIRVDVLFIPNPPQEGQTP